MLTKLKVEGGLEGEGREVRWNGFYRVFPRFSLIFPNCFGDFCRIVPAFPGIFLDFHGFFLDLEPGLL